MGVCVDPQELMKRVKEQSVMNLPTRTLVTVKDLRSKNQVGARFVKFPLCVEFNCAHR